MHRIHESESPVKQLQPDPGSAQFGYDGQSRRVSETVNGALVRRWVWCGTELCEERDGAGSVVESFHPEGDQWLTGANAGQPLWTRDIR